MLLQACLNGSRGAGSHKALPLTPDELADDALRVVAEGAEALHVHPRDANGRESLDATVIGQAIEAIRSSTDVPVGVSTGAWFLPNPTERVVAVKQWKALPDYASVNFHEEGAVEVAQALLERGIAIEAGLWNSSAAEVLARSGLTASCLRVLLEPMDANAADALATVRAIERVLASEAPSRMLHGVDATTWAMIDEAIGRNYDTRIGLEDTLTMPDGTAATDNAALVSAAKSRIPAAS